MGLTYLEGVVRTPGRGRRGRSVRFLVDSGAVYSVLPAADWKGLNLKPERDLDFVLADGTTLTRGVSECMFELEGRRATSPVVLGETEDEALLGAVTLETLGLMLNPLNRTLQPMRMVLARVRSRLLVPPRQERPSVRRNRFQSESLQHLVRGRNRGGDYRQAALLLDDRHGGQ